ncbi:MAG: hypothetical protein ACJ0DD_02470 [Paracoccaceae bacterium]
MNKLAILQLDTNFKRIAGDICSKKTFLRNVNIIKIKNAVVSEIITKNPKEQHYLNFKKKILTRNEKVITTSCGFTFYWQDYFNNLTKSDVITSSLCCLDNNRKIYKDNEILIFTFDEEILKSLLVSKLKTPFKGHILGLRKYNLLYKIISNNEKNFEFEQICYELKQLLWETIKNLKIKLIILECTNLSPYKNIFRTIFSGEIIDLLVLIEKKIPGTIKKELL